MKFLMVPLCSLVLISCTQGNQSSTYSASNITAASSQASFGENLEFGAKVADQIFTFTKSASESSADSTVALSSSGNAFSIVSATGCNKSLTKASDKCLVKVRFIGTKVSGSHLGVLSVGSFNLALSASVLPDSTFASISFSEGSVDLSSVDFGELSAKTSLQKIITVSNSGTKDLASVVSLTGDSNFVIVSNACTTTLKAGKTCLVKLSFKADSVAPTQVATKAATLSVSGSTLALVGSLKAQEVVSTPAVLKLYESSALLESVNFGALALNSTSSKVLTLKNEGGSTITPIVSVDGGFSATTTGCASLKSGSSCYIRLVIQAKQSSGSGVLMVAGTSLSIPLSYGSSSSGVTCSELICLAKVDLFMDSQDGSFSVMEEDITFKQAKELIASTSESNNYYTYLVFKPDANGLTYMISMPYWDEYDGSEGGYISWENIGFDGKTPSEKIDFIDRNASSKMSLKKRIDYEYVEVGDGLAYDRDGFVATPGETASFSVVVKSWWNQWLSQNHISVNQPIKIKAAMTPYCSISGTQSEEVVTCVNVPFELIGSVSDVVEVNYIN